MTSESSHGSTRSAEEVKACGRGNLGWSLQPVGSPPMTSAGESPPPVDFVTSTANHNTEAEVFFIPTEFRFVLGCERVAGRTVTFSEQDTI